MKDWNHRRQLWRSADCKKLVHFKSQSDPANDIRRKGIFFRTPPSCFVPRSASWAAPVPIGVLNYYIWHKVWGLWTSILLFLLWWWYRSIDSEWVLSWCGGLNNTRWSTRVCIFVAVMVLRVGSSGILSSLAVRISDFVVEFQTASHSIPSGSENRTHPMSLATVKSFCTPPLSFFVPRSVVELLPFLWHKVWRVVVVLVLVVVI